MSQLCLELDNLAEEMSEQGFLIVAATNKPENLAESLRRPGRQVAFVIFPIYFTFLLTHTSLNWFLDLM